MTAAATAHPSPRVTRFRSTLPNIRQEDFRGFFPSGWGSGVKWRSCVTFDQWLAFVALGEARTSDYPAIAEQGLVEGLESVQLAALAGVTARETSPFELQELLERGLLQANRSIPGRAEAGKVMMRYYAAQVVSGALSPREGAARIVQLATDLTDVLPTREYVGDGLGVARLVGLYYSHDDVAWNDDRAHAEIDEELLDECRTLSSQ
jgi:hypothetical protein